MDGSHKSAGKDMTLHQRILQDLEGRIISGEWPPGHRIPFEVDLADSFGCSRMTVNKVMAQLAKAGLIERRKKSGSFVIWPKAQCAILEITDIGAEVRSLNLVHRHEVVKRQLRKAKPEDLARLEISGPLQIVDIVCVHYAGSRVFCLEERIISLDAAPDAAMVDFTGTTPGAWLLEQVPWSTAEHRINARSASHDEAKLMQIRVGTACLIVERRTFGRQGPLTRVRISYPGDHHVLVARFTPSGQGA